MSCKIQLTNFSRPYFPGNHIMGKVICDFQSSVDVRGISVKLKGLEKVYWARGRNTYTARNKFMDTKISLAQEGVLGIGVHEFPFMFTLPLELPSSYRGRYGWVTYTLKANVERSMKLNYKNKVTLPVISPIDQSTIPDRSLLRPGVFDGEKTVCCLCCAGGTVSMEVNLEKTTFVPGEEINVAVRVSNQSNHSIRNVKAIYWMAVKSSVPGLLGSESIVERTELAKTKETGLGAREEKYYKLVLKLPMIDAVPNFLNSIILSFASAVEVIAVLPKFHLNLKVPISSFLADIPIGGRAEYYERIEKAGVYVPPKKGKNFNRIDSSNTLHVMGA